MMKRTGMYLRRPCSSKSSHRGADSFHVIQQMAQLVLLGLQIATVLFVRRYLDRNSFDNPQTVAIEADDFLGIIRQEPNFPDTQIDQDLRPNAIVPEVGSEAQPAIGLDGIQAFPLLQLVCLQFAQETDAPSLLAH